MQLDRINFEGVILDLCFCTMVSALLVAELSAGCLCWWMRLQLPGALSIKGWCNSASRLWSFWECISKKASKFSDWKVKIALQETKPSWRNMRNNCSPYTAADSAAWIFPFALRTWQVKLFNLFLMTIHWRIPVWVFAVKNMNMLNASKWFFGVYVFICFVRICFGGGSGKLKWMQKKVDSSACFNVK